MTSRPNFAHRIQCPEPLSGLIDDTPSALDRLGGDVEAEVFLDRAGEEAAHRVRLLSAATALIEPAHEAAVAGRSSALTDDDYADAARRLRAAAGDIAALADATMVVIARPGPENGRDSP